jgi:hypothetical protein
MDTTIITFIGIILTTITACITIIVTSKTARKEMFIGVVTTARKEYIQQIRTCAAEFCWAAGLRTNNQTSSLPPQALEKLGYQLKLMMNPASYSGWWDDVAVDLIDKIINTPTVDDVKKFVALMQSWLALEWTGMMNESKKGNLSNSKKEKLRNKYWEEYNDYKND